MDIIEYYSNNCYMDDDTAEAMMARHAAAVISLPNGGSVLDIGCGTGGMFNELIAAGAYDIVGIDICPGMIAEAEKNKSDGRISLINDDFMNLQDGGFDLLIAFDSYNHFQDPRAFAEHAHSLLKREGRLTVAYAFGRERTNAISRVMPEGISRELLHPWRELKAWDEFFHVDCMVDNDRLYMLSGTAL